MYIRVVYKIRVKEETRVSFVSASCGRRECQAFRTTSVRKELTMHLDYADGREDVDNDIVRVKKLGQEVSGAGVNAQPGGKIVLITKITIQDLWTKTRKDT